jgi:hypothetical protein
MRQSQKKNQKKTLFFNIKKAKKKIQKSKNTKIKPNFTPKTADFSTQIDSKTLKNPIFTLKNAPFRHFQPHFPLFSQPGRSRNP